MSRHHQRDPRRQPIIVAVFDLRRRDRVVSFTTGMAPSPQRLDRMPRIEIPPPLFRIAERQQDLRNRHAVLGRERLIRRRETELPDGRRSWLCSSSAAPWQPEPNRPSATAPTTRAQLTTRLAQRRDVCNDERERSAFNCPLPGPPAAPIRS